MTTPISIGVIGFGSIGSFLVQQIEQNPGWGLEIGFVADNLKSRDIPPDLLLVDLSQAREKQVALIVEAAHPEVTVNHGAEFLSFCDYMPLSLTALADSALEGRLKQTAEAHGTCLYIPHGAAVGIDSLAECADLWESVTVTMRKNPKNIDFSAALEIDPKTISGETVLYDGPTRQVCAKFPRNVNSHAAVAMAGIGFDRTRSILVADPKLDVSIIELSAVGNGVKLDIVRSNPLKGVSGVLTLRSILGCVQRAKATGLSVQVC